LIEQVEWSDAPVDATHTQVFGEPVFEFMLPLFRASVRSEGGRGCMAADRVERLYIVDVFLCVELEFGRKVRDGASASGTSDERHGEFRDRQIDRVDTKQRWKERPSRKKARGVDCTFHSSGLKRHLRPLDAHLLESCNSPHALPDQVDCSYLIHQDNTLLPF
jgi:hypothetical protein